MPDRDVRYAISIDDEKPQIITLIPRNYDAKNGNTDWEQSVSDNFRKGSSRHLIKHAWLSYPENMDGGSWRGTAKNSR